MAEKELDKEFVEYVVKSIVDNPDNVEVERSIDERGVLITLTVDPSDMGKIIGKEGRTAKAIRTLLRVLGAKSNSRVNMKVVEPGGGDAEGGASVSADQGETDTEAAPAEESNKEEVEEESEATKAAKAAQQEAEEAADIEI